MITKRQFKIRAGRKTVITILLTALLSMLIMDASANSGNPNVINAQLTSHFYKSSDHKSNDQSSAILPEEQYGELAAGGAISHTISYSYAPSGRLISVDYGDGVLLLYKYDLAGNLIYISDHLSIFLPLIIR